MSEEAENTTQEAASTSTPEPASTKEAEGKPSETNEWLEAVNKLKAERAADRKERERPSRSEGGETNEQEEDTSEANVESEKQDSEEADEDPAKEDPKTDKKKKDDKLFKRAETLAKRERELSNKERSLNEERTEWRLRQAKFADMVAEAQKIKHEASTNPLSFLEQHGVTPTKLHELLYEKYGERILDDKLKEEDPNDPKVQIRELKKQLTDLLNDRENGQKQKQQQEDEERKQQLTQQQQAHLNQELEIITSWTNDPKLYPTLVSYGEQGFKDLQEACYIYQKNEGLKELNIEHVRIVAQSLDRILREQDEKEFERISRARGSATSAAASKKGKGNASPSVEGSEDGKKRGETLGNPKSPGHVSKKPFDREKWAAEWASKL